VIDANLGTVSLAPGATLDFEASTNYTVTVSVSDGFTRSQHQTVAIAVTNLNDNAPVFTAGQSFRVDDGYRGTIGKVQATDAVVTHTAEVTTCSSSTITAR